LLTGAESLATRYNYTFKAYDAIDWSKKWDFVVNADSLISMDMMFLAAENGGDAQYKEMTLNHFKKAADTLLRQNGSMHQLSSFKTNVWNLEFIGSHQGYSDNTTWSRGQGWAIRSFPVAYRYTRDPAMLEAAIKVCDYYIQNVPSDGVPFWDFEAPTNPDEEKDSSAAAASVCGMFELSEVIEDESLKIKYWNAAVKILDSLCSPEYLAENSIHQGLLQHGVGKHPSNVEVDVSLIYGDYYYMQALARYTRLEKRLQ
jgi:unsaturated chondroitin disaccharide hydrolase